MHRPPRGIVAGSTTVVLVAGFTPLRITLLTLGSGRVTLADAVGVFAFSPHTQKWQER